jgi:L-cysteine desulfidase
VKKGDALYQQFLDILREELRPAMGCTEPIALAYAGAKARQLLGRLPQSVQIYVSGNIIKNVKSVIVPNTGGLHGIGPAVCAGIVAGDADRVLEVISQVTQAQRQQLKQYMETVQLQITPSESTLVFDIDLTLRCEEQWVRLRIANHHNRVFLS